MVLNWEFLPLFAGFVIGFFLYQKYMFRGGGVIILPLLAIYFVKFPLSFPKLLFSALITYGALEVLYTRYIVYGRRLLYLALVIGMVVTLAFEDVLSSIGWYALVLPGLFAYNLHRENNSTSNMLKSAILLSVTFVFLVCVSLFSLYMV
ncbi:hypothetical protein ANME2D_02429 [Candidatus Methanoperedens nitroreducens]|uniref:Uncharacterized protein n=1 Tax=Candidatus Methanoperedens nitratireducens TaxID=1392998 RepID=A0A062V2U4_9EURY|nr:poly-gamma-glutamate biosynthesis protein PgsC/CapC [Candidatus Methanoperedens nitroreducens]KCZ71692.1 hypothetical protein ANME2D_02429 [Candidatus Methanoperedens nitroreducens]MDJ1421319.1 poly-gamma-glutamate biosynthesis protein PgsC/CapC [Candidatus Methanoperedens sp.]